MALDTLKDKTNVVPKTMVICRFYGPRDIRYEKVDIPEIKDEELLVKVKVAISGGSSLKTYLRGHPVLVNKELPSPFGHQFSGEVVKAGDKVKRFQAGNKIVAVNSSPCFKCTYCLSKKFSLCENIYFLNGAFADYICIPKEIVENNTYKLSDNLSFEVAAELESLAVVLHGLERSHITEGQTVCILGTGSIGLLFTALSKELGAEVIVIGRSDFKLNLAQEMGADHVLKISGNEEKLIRDVKNITNNIGPEVVIEAVGKKETWELATKLVKKGGLVNFFGGCKKGEKVELDTYRLHYDELRLIGVFHHTPEYVRKALELLEKNISLQEKITSKLITHRYPLSRLIEAFAMQQKGNCIQAAIYPEN